MPGYKNLQLEESQIFRTVKEKKKNPLEDCDQSMIHNLNNLSRFSKGTSIN